MGFAASGNPDFANRWAGQMTGCRIRISGYRLNKAGELVPDVLRLSG